MSLGVVMSPEALAFLASKGLTLDDVVELSRLMAPPSSPRSLRSERNARYHAKKVASRASEDPSEKTSCKTSDETSEKGFSPPLRDNQNPSSLPKSSLRSVLSGEREFLDFWSVVPRKVGRDTARKAFVRIVSGGRATADQVIAGAIRWRDAARHSDPDFVPHPTTWLNRGGWEDEPRQPRAGPGRGGGRTVAEMAALNLDETDIFDEPRTDHGDGATEGPERTDQAEADLLAVYRSRLRRLPGEVRLSITDGDRPRGLDLAAIQGRADALRSYPAASEGARKAMISRLFLRFPNMAKASEEVVTSYARDLAEFPAWAVAKGLMDIVSGLVLKAPEFPPSGLQVRAAVAERFRPVREELALISGLLEACDRAVPNPSPEVAAERRKTLADQLRNSLRISVSEPEPRAQRNPNLPSTFDDAKSAPAGAMALSDAARRAARYPPWEEKDAR